MIETSPETAADRPRIDLGEVARESTSESVARENEIVEHLAHEDEYPDHDAQHPRERSVEEQLAALVDPEVIRRSGGGS